MIVTAQQLMDLQNEIGHGVVVSVSASSVPALLIKIEWRSPGKKDFRMEFALTHRDFMNDTIDLILHQAAEKTKYKIESLIK